MLSFDEARMIMELERLAPRLRAVFAAACAERLRPAYLAFSARTGKGDPGEFEAILDRLWSDLDGQPMTDREIDTSVKRSSSEPAKLRAR